MQRLAPSSASAPRRPATGAAEAAGVAGPHDGIRRRQGGVAIISVLVIVMLVSLIVGSLFWREFVATRSIQNRLAMAQLRWIETAVLDWAAVVLQADQRAAGEVDHLLETWATPVAETQLDETVTAGASIGGASDNALLAGQIQDAQARIDLNGLVRDGQVVPERQAMVERLFAMLGLPAGLIQPLISHLTAPRHTVLPLLRLSDLMQLPGYEPEVIETLSPFVVFIPSVRPGASTAVVTTRININTAPAEVIAAALEGLGLDEARRFVLIRERTYFTSLQLAQSRFGRPVELDPERFAVKSSYFLLRGMVRFGRVEAQSEALFFRAPSRVELLWRHRI
jgi:general secretion pathway protein K